MNTDPVRAYVLEGIAASRLRPEQKLPTEREFSIMFRRPRSAVRKALTILEAEGRIERHVGRGTFVTPTAKDARETPGLDPDVGPAELITARLVFEPNLADVVVSNANGADFRRLDSAIAAMAGAASLEAYEGHDAAFHLAIAQATHNELLVRMAQILVAARRNASWGRLKEKQGTFAPARRRQVRSEHEAILAAVKERDADLLRRRIQDHLLGVRRNLFGY